MDQRQTFQTWLEEVWIPSPLCPEAWLPPYGHFPDWHFQRQSKKDENQQKIIVLWKEIVMSEVKMQKEWWEEKYMGTDLKMENLSMVNIVELEFIPMNLYRPGSDIPSKCTSA